MIEHLNKLGIDLPQDKLHWNKSKAVLVEDTLKLGKGVLASNGALVVETGKHTGRAAKDKYVVLTESTQATVDWNPEVLKMSPETFTKLKAKVVDYLNQQDRLYISDHSVGAEKDYNLTLRLYTPSPSHNIFALNLFRKTIREYSVNDYTVLHAPELEVDPAEFESRSGTIITTNFDEKTIIICGTRYAGEIKKSIFSIMNYLLPGRHVLPMHSGASIGKTGEACLFFGLSGTGKTTLSSDEGTQLIGDDEHGLSDTGIFNFEGGCYAKMIKLSKENEPEIYEACTQFGALLENVVIDPETREPDFDDNSLAENSRGSYPIEFIDERVESGLGPIPKHMFFLTCDAFGVLPPVSKLTKNQAMYYFLSGYTAKVAGTEMGVKEPQATFSTCFGSPFMLRRPQEYGEILGEYLDKLNIKVWLVNTGWTEGPYGEGHRISLSITRKIIRAIQANTLNDAETFKDEIFGLNIPKEIPGFFSGILNPRDTWKDKEAYDQMAQKLANMFHENFRKYEGISEDIVSGGPTFKN